MVYRVKAEVAGDRSRSLRSLTKSLYLVQWGEELVKDQMSGWPCLFLLSLPPLTFYLRGGMHQSHTFMVRSPLCWDEGGELGSLASDTTVSPPICSLCSSDLPPPGSPPLLWLLPPSFSPARFLPAFQGRHFSASALSLPSFLSRTFHS